jgi:hypothetical protein
LRGHRILDASAPGSNKCKHGRGLRVWHFRDDDEVVLTEREIQVEQLAARLLAQPRNRRFPVLGLSQPPLM